MKRIAQVSWYDPAHFPPIINTARTLSASGHQVICLGVNRGNPTPIRPSANVEFRYLNDSPGEYAKTLTGRLGEAVGFRRDVRHELRQLQPDLIIAYDHWGLWAADGVFAERGTVYHILDILDRRRTGWLSRERWISLAADRAIARCRLLVTPERRRLGYLKTRMDIRVPSAAIANVPLRRSGIRDTQFKRLIADRSGVHPEFLIVVVGNMGMYSETIEAVAQLDERWHLAVIGCGSAADKLQMQRDAARHRVDRRCHFFEYTPYDTVSEWLQSCDVGLALYPNRGVNWHHVGTSSVKAMEYMAAAVPTLVLHGSGFDDLIAEGAVSPLSAPTTEALAAAIRALDPGSAEWRRASADAFAAHFSVYYCELQSKPLLRLLD